MLWIRLHYPHVSNLWCMVEPNHPPSELEKMFVRVPMCSVHGKIARNGTTWVRFFSLLIQALLKFWVTWILPWNSCFICCCFRIHNFRISRFPKSGFPDLQIYGLPNSQKSTRPAGRGVDGRMDRQAGGRADCKEATMIPWYHLEQTKKGNALEISCAFFYRPTIAPLRMDKQLGRNIW